MSKSAWRRVTFAGVVALLLATFALASLHSPTASAQIVCSDPSMNCPVVYNTGIMTYPSYVTTPTYTTVMPTYTTPATVYVAPSTLDVAPSPGTIYVAPSTYSVATTEPVVTVNPAPDYVSPGGGYCTMADGGQVWVPAGVSPADMGC